VFITNYQTSQTLAVKSVNIKKIMFINKIGWHAAVSVRRPGLWRIFPFQERFFGILASFPAMWLLPILGVLNVLTAREAMPVGAC
jgi:hypothetical protein